MIKGLKKTLEVFKGLKKNRKYLKKDFKENDNEFRNYWFFSFCIIFFLILIPCSETDSSDSISLIDLKSFLN